MNALRRVLLGDTASRRVALAGAFASLFTVAACSSSSGASGSVGTGSAAGGEAAAGQGSHEGSGGAPQSAGEGGAPSESVAGAGGDATGEVGDIATESLIDEEGGHLSVAGASLEVPAGALSSAGAVSIRITKLPAEVQRRLPTPELPGALAIGWASSSYGFTPHGLTFDAPVKVVLPYTGDANYVLRLDDERDDSWEPVEGVTFDSGLASFETSHFSVYAAAMVEECQPATCASLPETFECGTYPDGCGGTIDAQLDCGLPECAEGDACSEGHTCECVPFPSCSEALSAVGQDCGVVPDGCGGTLDCSQVCPSAAGAQQECLFHGNEFGGTEGVWQCTRPCAGTGECPQYTAISASWWDTCGLRTDQSIACWGHTKDDGFNPPPGQFVALSTGYWQTCGIRVDGTLACWGAPRDANVDGNQTPTGKFTAVSADLYHSCGIHQGGAVECWGYGADGRTSAPSGTFQAVAAGNYHSCGVRPEGTVECWPPSINGLMGPPPTGPFTTIVGGVNENCALGSNGIAACWGYGTVAHLPVDTWAQIDLGDYDVCGLRADKTLACAGPRANSQAPAGQFGAVAVGTSHACALRLDGTAVCWGDNSFGQSTPPGP